MIMGRRVWMGFEVSQTGSLLCSSSSIVLSSTDECNHPKYRPRLSRVHLDVSYEIVLEQKNESIYMILVN